MGLLVVNEFNMEKVQEKELIIQHSKTYYNIMQHNTTQYNIMQPSTIYYNIVQQRTTYYNIAVAYIKGGKVGTVLSQVPSSRHILGESSGSKAKYTIFFTPLLVPQFSCTFSNGTHLESTDTPE